MGGTLIKADKRSALMFTTIVGVFFAFNITTSYAQAPVVTELSQYTKQGQFFNPYRRQKNGPPLKNVVHKVNNTWIFGWIKNTKNYDPGARMPFLFLEDDEVKAIMAYLASIADKEPPYPKGQWEDFLLKPQEGLSDEEYDKVDKVIAKGKGVWSIARCGICHAQKGIGGFVPVAPDLGKLSLKVSNRDWLHFWVNNPRDHFPNTMMPQFKMPEEDLRALIEYILKSEDFMPEYEEEEEGEERTEKAGPPIDEITYSKDPAMIEKGKHIITVSRCVVCHDIEGIKEVLPVAKKEPAPTEGFPKIVFERRCLTCHNIRGEGGTFAPPWDPIGSKLKDSWITDFLQTPQPIRPILQQMPRLFISEEEAKTVAEFMKGNFTMPTFGLTEEEAKTAADYMKKVFTEEGAPTDLFKEGEVDEKRAEAGKKFFNDYGCGSCHAVGPVGGVIGPNLTRAGERLEPGWIYWHLKNPRHAMLDTAEPRYNLSEEEIINLVHFLMSCREKGTS